MYSLLSYQLQSYQKLLRQSWKDPDQLQTCVVSLEEKHGDIGPPVSANVIITNVMVQPVPAHKWELNQQCFIPLCLAQCVATRVKTLNETAEVELHTYRVKNSCLCQEYFEMLRDK